MTDEVAGGPDVIDLMDLYHEAAAELGLTANDLLLPAGGEDEAAEMEQVVERVVARHGLPYRTAAPLPPAGEA